MPRSQRLEFMGVGGEMLAARLDLPDSEPLAYALFAHCFTCSKDGLAPSRISRGLTARGIAVMRFDFTGLGQSGGDFANATFSSNVDDLVRAAAHLREVAAAPQLLIGHSLGGAAVLAAARAIPEVHGVATIGAPSSPAHVASLFGEAKSEIDAAGEAEVILAGRAFRIRKTFLDDIAEQPQKERIAKLRCALIVFHAVTDETVGIDNAREIFDAAKHPKSFIALDGADHLLTKPADAAYVADMIGTWAQRYIDQIPHPAQQVASIGAVVVTEDDGAFAERATARQHMWAIDEPLANGGSDTGPDPYEVLLSALGACTAMTLRSYATRKNWEVGQISVALQHNRVHAVDCVDCETAPAAIDRIVREIQIAGDLGDDKKAALLEIANKCPVHRTLEADIVIETDVL